MGKMLHNAGQKATAERRGQTTHITPQAQSCGICRRTALI